MFDSIGWGEIVVLALAALFIFGPERLPHLAKDAAAGLKKVRGAITGMRAQVDESLGDDLAGLRDLDLRKYHPKTFIREQLLADDDDEPPVRRGVAQGNGSGGLGTDADGRRMTPGRRALAARQAAAARPRDAGSPPPFDVDAT
ncbi:MULTISPECIES: twin-arginine translocase TatA/TatE family subunit [unclassified Blastococcus]